MHLTKAVVTALAVMVLLSTVAGAEEYVQGEVIVQYLPAYSPGRGVSASPDPGLAELLDSYGVYEQVPLCDPSERPQGGHPDGVWTLAEWDTAAEAVNLFDWFLVKYTDPSDPPDVAGVFRASGYFAEAGPNHLGEYTTLRVEPDDGYFDEQWHLDYDTVPTADIDAPEGWYWLGGEIRNVKVGIIDTGIWSSNGEYSGIHVDIKANVDEDAINDLDTFPQDNHFTSHGTRHARIISAVTNNTVGVAGVTWNRGKLIIVKNTIGGFPDEFKSAKGIVFCVDHYAEVLNMSWVIEDTALIRKAMQHAMMLDVSMVASFNNTGGEDISFPASFGPVIGVGGTDKDGDFWEGSSWWYDTMFCTAPAVDIFSTYKGSHQNYGNDTGNSYAAPQVSGVLALIRGKKAGTYPDLDEWAKDDLRKSCEHPDYFDSHEGYGKVSVKKALGPRSGPIPPPPGGCLSEDVVASYALGPNFPNPVAGTTSFAFEVGEGCEVDTAVLIIYDISGRRVAELEKPIEGPGEYEITWDVKTGGTTAAPGVYVYELEVGDYKAARKMIIQ
jgi:subtilisin family serine protease